MNLKQLHDNLNARLAGAPDEALTYGLLGVAALLVIAAFAAPADVKLVVLTWAVAP